MSLFTVITCEHAGNRIPQHWRHHFHAHWHLLRTHRGYDAGALRLAREMAAALNAPLVLSSVSRLLIDLNRSLHHPRLHSEATRALPREARREIAERHYHPYRQHVEELIANAVKQDKQVLHLSVHTFTPEVHGKVRNTDAGLLYDPARVEEAQFCRHWQAALHAQPLRLKTRMNYPYAGTADGFTVALRRRFAAERYLGVELEINQRHVHAGAAHWRTVRETVIAALHQACLLQDDRPGHGAPSGSPSARE